MTNGINLVALATAKSITAKCETHGIDYKKHDFFGRGYHGICPECAKEADRIKFDAEQKAIKAENEARLNKLREDRIKSSATPISLALSFKKESIPLYTSALIFGIIRCVAASSLYSLVLMPSSIVTGKQIGRAHV